MKKFRTLVGVIAASSILIGAGYAGWSEQVALETTVETGTFCVQINNVKRSENSTDFQDVKLRVEDLDRHSNESVPETGQQVELKIENMYPGSELIYQVDFKNLGSVDAVMESFLVGIGEQTELLEYIDVSISDSDSDRIENWHTINMLTKDITSLNKKFEIKKGETKSLFIKVEMNEEVTSAFDHHRKHELDVQLGFNWIQSNLGPKQEPRADQNN